MNRKIINDIQIKPIKEISTAHKLPKGHKMFGDIVFPNIGMISKKHSGKTVLLWNMLREAIDKKTIIHIFCSTANRDQTWKDMIKWLKKNGNPVDVNLGLHETIKEGKRKKKVNKLDQILDKLKAEDKENMKDSKKKKKKDKKEKPEQIALGLERKNIRSITKDMLGENHIVHVLFPNNNKAKKGGNDVILKVDRPKKQGKLVAPDRIFLFDDLSSELKDPAIPRLLKIMRHLNSIVFLSTQYIRDIAPSSRTQFDIITVFAGHDDSKLEAILKMCDLPISFEKFREIYHDATRERFNFLYVNCRTGELRRNINEVYEL
jgi:hypothetical protein